ncbi:MAG: type II toxin-antitoxin system RelE/ParE family toxin [Rickettsiales bacterium]|nr:type II toxin-antitoxin system RelE/ParE family toxin [Rickettsiales bacterium]
MFYEVSILYDEYGWSFYQDWIDALDEITSERIKNRINRVKFGNFGDFKNVYKNIYELRFFFGSGYRVYFAKEGKNIILLLAGGDKLTQKKDIKKAIEIYEKYKSK